MASPEVGYLCIGGIELIHDARVLSYLYRGLAGAAMSTSIGVQTSGSVSGIVEAVYSDTYCLDPSHRLLTADLRWVPCGELQAGDELFAFDDEPIKGNRNRRWQRSEVTRSEPAMKECVRVFLGNGDAIVCSSDHPWLARTSTDGKPRWIKSADLMRYKSPRVERLFTPWEFDQSYEAGWLAGMYDGEGSLIYGDTVRMDLAQVPGPVLDRCAELLRTMKIDARIHPGTSSASHLHVAGGYGETMRVLGTLRPMRLLEKLALADLSLKSIKRHTSQLVDVLAVERIGPSPVQSITTSTRTYIGEGYAMHNSDPYGTLLTIDCADVYAPVCLQCACPTLTLEEDFTDPETDDAPWFQASSPTSAEFLGATALVMELPPATARSQQPRVRFGGTPSPQRLLPRIMQVTARLFAATPAGMEWGKRWFNDVLAGTCDGGADAVFLPYCPTSEQDPDTVYRVLAETILVDGPTWVEIGAFGEFRALEARFQLASSAPWLLGLPYQCEHANLAPGGSTSCLIETDDWGGGQAVSVQLEGDMNGVTVSAVPLAADQPCPVVGTSMHCSEFTVQGTQNGDVLIVDSSRRSALLTDTTSKNDVSAVPYLDFVGSFPWIDAPPCTRLCVTVTNNGSGAAEVTIDTVLREL